MSDISKLINIGTSGEVAERSKAHAWKACNPKGFVGSNPTLTAKPKAKWFRTALFLVYDERVSGIRRPQAP